MRMKNSPWLNVHLMTQPCKYSVTLEQRTTWWFNVHLMAQPNKYDFAFEQRLVWLWKMLFFKGLFGSGFLHVCTRTILPPPPPPSPASPQVPPHLLLPSLPRPPPRAPRAALLPQPRPSSHRDAGYRDAGHLGSWCVWFVPWSARAICCSHHVQNWFFLIHHLKLAFATVPWNGVLNFSSSFAPCKRETSRTRISKAI